MFANPLPHGMGLISNKVFFFFFVRIEWYVHINTTKSFVQNSTPHRGGDGHEVGQFKTINFARNWMKCPNLHTNPYSQSPNPHMSGVGVSIKILSWNFMTHPELHMNSCLATPQPKKHGKGLEGPIHWKHLSWTFHGIIQTFYFYSPISTGDLEPEMHRKLLLGNLHPLAKGIGSYH